MITIVIPIKNPYDLDLFIENNKEIFKKHKVIVIDSGGGEKIQQCATKYIKKDVKLPNARMIGYDLTTTKYVMNLDSDVVIPEGYIDKAISLLESGAFAVSIFYEDVEHCQGALEYGISIWNTEKVRKLYDFSFDMIVGDIVKIGPQTYSSLVSGWCECTYMWRKIKDNNGKLETLPIRAIHLKREEKWLR